MKDTSFEMDHSEILVDILQGSLNGKNAHLKVSQALEGLKLDVTGRKILNTPYTIWQLLKHINHWQDKFIAQLHGDEVSPDHSWTEGWEETYNGGSEKELEAEINKLVSGIEWVCQKTRDGHLNQFKKSKNYQTPYNLIQAMGSHISYHLAEIIILRRIFGAWPPPSGGYVW